MIEQEEVVSMEYLKKLERMQHRGRVGQKSTTPKKALSSARNLAYGRAILWERQRKERALQRNPAHHHHHYKDEFVPEQLAKNKISRR